MSYLVFARKYRPTAFDNVTGQEHVTRALGNAIRRERVAHAYLFSGPRGVGKTSIARIFAKCLNCSNGPTTEPCGECSNCKEITNGSSIAVREIDGASHNSVENVRDLIDSLRSLPPAGSSWKVYIIDEVHMLSNSAFNALLKSLEEPPPHTVLILATTEPHKIPDTVLSRCQRYDFRSLTGNEVVNCLHGIAEKEGIEVETEVLRTVARLSEGSLRDAQSLFDRIQSSMGEKITAKEANEILGVVDQETLLALSRAIVHQKPDDALDVVWSAFSTGLDPALFLKEFAAHWRELLIAKFTGENGLKRINTAETLIPELLRITETINRADIQDLAELARSGADNALRSAHPKFAFEALIVRMATREPVEELATLIMQLERGGSLGRAPVVRTASQIEKKKSIEPDRSRPSMTEVPRGAAALSYPSSDAPQRAANHSFAHSSSNAAEKIDPVGTLDWNQYVRSIILEAPRLFAEQLKRMRALRFEEGRLSLGGPEFTVSYFQRKENTAKLAEYLKKQSEIENWKIDFETVKDVKNSLKGTVHEEERIEAKQALVRRSEALENSEQVKIIQEVFPNSEVVVKLR